MRTFVTAAPATEPPAAPVPAPRCARRPDLHAPRRVPHHAVTPRSRRPAPAHAPDTPATAPPDAHRFAEVALRLTLEVLDRRRQPHQLRTMLAAAPLGLVSALARADSPGRRLGAAQLRRIHLRSTGPDTVELFGSYQRGDRTFAVAGRIERAPVTGGTGARGGWVFTSLQVG